MQPHNLQDVTTKLNEFKSFEWSAVERRNLGERSLYNELQPIKAETLLLVDLALVNARLVDHNTVGEIIGFIETLNSKLNEISQLRADQYIQQKNNILHNLRDLLASAREWKTILTAAAVLRMGLPETERALGAFRAEASEVQKNVEDTATKKIQEFESVVRTTAEKISIEEARKQFEEASNHDSTQIRNWWAGVAVSMGILITTTLLFLILGSKGGLADGLLRVFVLSALAGATTFTLRMLRAHLHIAEKNRHRVRVARCIGSFLMAASGPNQRDQILAKLTDAIVDYGDSGLIPHGRDASSSTMPGNTLHRIASTS